MKSTYSIIQWKDIINWLATLRRALVYEVYISQLLCYCSWYFRKLNTVIFYIKFVIYKCQLICDCIKQQIVTIVKSNMMNFIKYSSFCDKRSAVKMCSYWDGHFEWRLIISQVGYCEYGLNRFPCNGPLTIRSCCKLCFYQQGAC
jgi:hypothetical protein